MKRIIFALLGMLLINSTIAQQTKTKVSGLPAYVYLPEGYDKGEKWPLIVFFPGLGESGAGTPVERLLTYGPSKYIGEGYKIPAIVISVQPSYGWVTGATINTILEDIMRTFKIDSDRIYLTGLSAGATGIEQFALTPAFCDKVTAIIPMSAPEVPAFLQFIPESVKGNIKWLGFVGRRDSHFQKMQMLFDRINDSQDNMAKLIIGDYSHCCWNDFYNPKYIIPGTTQNIYQWMLSQGRGQDNGEPPVVPVDTGRRVLRQIKVYTNGDVETY